MLYVVCVHISVPLLMAIERTIYEHARSRFINMTLQPLLDRLHMLAYEGCETNLVTTQDNLGNTTKTGQELRHENFIFIFLASPLFAS